jgi:hypothetical protein
MLLSFTARVTSAPAFACEVPNTEMEIGPRTLLLAGHADRAGASNKSAAPVTGRMNENLICR